MPFVEMTQGSTEGKAKRQSGDPAQDEKDSLPFFFFHLSPLQRGLFELPTQVFYHAFPIVQALFQAFKVYL